MVVLLTITGALAGPPALVGEVAGRLEAGTSDAASARTAGALVSLGLPVFGDNAEIDGVFAAHAGMGGDHFDGQLRARAWLAAPAEGPSVALGYGVRKGRSGFRPAGSVGAAWDLPVGPEQLRHRIRVGGGVQLDGLRPEAGVFTLGWAFGPPPVVDVPPAPAPEPELFPEGTRVWLPHPVCRWVDADELDAVLAELPADQSTHVHAESYATMFTRADQVSADDLQPAPSQGALLVVGAPGDRVQVGGSEVPAGADGVVQLAVPEGMVRAEVVGGGRRMEVSAAISRGHGTWVRVPPPPSVVVEFDSGSARLTPEARTSLAALVEDVGGWRYELQGGFSPEGNRAANVALASRRAESVRATLLELGLSPDRVVVVAPAVPEDATDAASRRVCTIRPRPAGEVQP